MTRKSCVRYYNATYDQLFIDVSLTLAYVQFGLLNWMNGLHELWYFRNVKNWQKQLIENR